MEHFTHLQKDKKLKKIIEKQTPLVLVKRKNAYLSICSAIISQQLSTKVAAVIYKRFLDLFHKKTPSPVDISLVEIETMRGIGLSYAKANYVHNVCKFFTANKVTDVKLSKMGDEELINFLVQIKGIGKWTAEMILMFTLGREDVFPIDDLGIQQGIALIYGLDTSNKKELQNKMIKIADKWKPYRTYASMYIWQYKDNKPG